MAMDKNRGLTPTCKYLSIRKLAIGKLRIRNIDVRSLPSPTL
jgi:hypothetical protein